MDFGTESSATGKYETKQVASMFQETRYRASKLQKSHIKKKTLPWKQTKLQQRGKYEEAEQCIRKCFLYTEYK